MKTPAPSGLLRVQIEIEVNEPRLRMLLVRALDAARITKPAPGPDEMFLPTEKKLSAKQLADALGVSARSISTWTKEGMPRTPAGRLPRYRLSACEAWLEQRDATKRERKEQREQQAGGLHPSNGHEHHQHEQ